MKSFIAIVAAVFTLNVTASFDGFLEVFNNTIIEDPWDEMTLEASIFSQREFDYAEISRTTAHIMENNFFDGMLGMKLEQLRDVDHAMEFFGEGYYCYRLVQEDEPQTEKLCLERLRKLVQIAFDIEGVSQIYILSAEGDYYGDWVTNFLIFENWDTKDSLVIEFDILHEI